MCNAPFGGVGGLFMPLLGHARWPKNPKYCSGCFRMLRENHGGAEIECSLLFADVRGSTGLAEQMSPKEFSRLMGWFFVPAMAGDAHAKRAVAAAMALMQRTLHARVGDRSIPIGAGVSTGTAYVGSIGTGTDTELTAMGDMVNTTARLASAAAAGEILVTAAAAAAAGLPSSLERRSLQLKGKSAPTEVAILTVT